MVQLKKDYLNRPMVLAAIDVLKQQRLQAEQDKAISKEMGLDRLELRYDGILIGIDLALSLLNRCFK